MQIDHCSGFLISSSSSCICGTSSGTSRLWNTASAARRTAHVASWNIHTTCGPKYQNMSLKIISKIKSEISWYRRYFTFGSEMKQKFFLDVNKAQFSGARHVQSCGAFIWVRRRQKLRWINTPQVVWAEQYPFCTCFHNLYLQYLYLRQFFQNYFTIIG